MCQLVEMISKIECISIHDKYIIQNIGKAIIPNQNAFSR